VYRRAGTYTITLIAQDPDGKVLRKPITLTVDPPSTTVTIRMTPEGGVAPLTVRFDASETVIPNEEITGFEWFFGDTSGQPQQRGALVEHVFQKPGTYTVHLQAFTTSGQSYDAEKTIVVRAPILDACALPSRTSGRAPLGVSFNMSCTTGNPTTILWDFGDDSQTDERNPVHVFEEPGVYVVTLTIKDALNTESKESITITAE
jgi:PKD repeat protein